MTNRIEEIKKEKDGLDMEAALFRYAELGWQAISEEDKERLKWWGIFYRKPTPGLFMIRVRITNGFSNARQFRTLAGIATQFGKGFADITTRQQIQLRNMTIEQVPEILRRLRVVGLSTLQTGMDNIRNIVGCPVAGINPDELFDASPVATAFTDYFLGNKTFSNLPRKFNVTITGCRGNCTHAETQDIAMVPATRGDRNGFNVLIGGKIGSGGLKSAWPLDLFVPPEEGAALAASITLLYRDLGPREARNRCRFAFLIEERGVPRIREELEKRVGRRLEPAGQEARREGVTDHIGVYRQRQPGLNFMGIVVPVGRIRSDQMLAVADLAEKYGNGEIRLTTAQNLILPNIPDHHLREMLDAPILKELSYAPSEVIRGLVSCTGSEYCGLALIETKQRAITLARELEAKLGSKGMAPLSIHWSGCPSGCGNHLVADIGFQGAKAKIDGKIVDAVHVYVRGERILEAVPTEKLPSLMETLVPHLVRTKGRVVREEPATTPVGATAKTAARAELREQEGRPVAVFCVGSRRYGIDAVCPHAGGPLSEGTVDGVFVTCPWHNYRFDLRTGACDTDPKLSARVYEVKDDS